MRHTVMRTPLKLLLAGLIAILLVSSVAAQDDSENAIQAKESFNSAIETIQSGDTSAAITLYKGAIALDGTLTDAYLNLGSIYFAQKSYADAATMFKKLTEIAPNDPVGFSNYGKVLAVMGKNTDALAAYQGALAADPDHVEAYKEIGKIHFEAKQYDESITALKEYTKRVANDPYSYYLLAAAYKKKEDDKNAIANYKKAIEFNAVHFESLRDLGESS